MLKVETMDRPSTSNGRPKRNSSPWYPTPKRKKKKKIAVKTENTTPENEESDSKHCPFCNQTDPILFDDSDFKPPAQEYDECALQIFAENPDPNEEQSQLRITNFSIYSPKCRHLCPIESMEGSQKSFFMAGFAKILLDENEDDLSASPYVKDAEVSAPWIYQDSGTKILIGVESSQENMCYYFGRPSDQYRDLYLSYEKAAFLLKAVTQTLLEEPELDVKRFLSRLCDFETPGDDYEGVLSVENFYQHAEFLLSHLSYYDSNRDEGELSLMETAVGDELCKICNTKKADVAKWPKKKGKRATKKEHWKPTMTPIIQSVFKDSPIGPVEDQREDPFPECSVLVEDIHKLPSKNGRIKNDLDLQVLYPLDKYKKDGQVFETFACMKRGTLEIRTGDLILVDDFEKTSSPSSTSTRRKNNSPRVDKEKNFNYPSWLEKSSPKKLYARVEYVSKRVEDDQILFHVVWLIPARKTILGSAGSFKEYFFGDECAEIPAKNVLKTENIVHFPIDQNWAAEAGTDDKDIIPKRKYVRHWYDSNTGKFYFRNEENDQKNGCRFCKKVKDVILPPDFSIKSIKKVPKIENLEEITYKSVKYSVGDHVLIDFDAFKMDFKPKKPVIKDEYVQIEPCDMNDPEYPERYRKKEKKPDDFKGSNAKTKNPFKIGQIEEICVNYDKKNAEYYAKNRKIDENFIKIKIVKYYRFKDCDKFVDCNDARRLYRSNEIAVINLKDLRGLCVVKGFENPAGPNLDQFLAESVFNFFCQQTFDALNNKCMDIKRDKIEFYTVKKVDTAPKPLKAMDLFSGCGGLSQGLDDSKFCETKWAVEFDAEAAQAFQSNFPKSTVYKEDCNKVLAEIIKGQDMLGRQKLPKRGEVEFIFGGPPCQGYSGMNRHPEGDNSLQKNSLIITFYGFVDILRPRFVLMENVRSFVSYKSNTIFQTALAALLRLGYQVQFGVLQAGSYGVPQNRKRIFIMAAAPDEILPDFPLPTHCFNEKCLSLNVKVGPNVFESRDYDLFTCGSAVHYTTCIWDAFSDLPIESAEQGCSCPYEEENPVTFYQKTLRTGKKRLVTDHVTKKLAPLILERIKLIPKRPDADWRDLPNWATTIHFYDNGHKKTLEIKKLKYKYRYSQELGRHIGVCPCCEGGPCIIKEKDVNTFIPFCLPHTGDRFNEWTGLYGRVDFFGFVNTIVTNPDPMGKQGRVLHPEANRVLTIREYARLQGFHDDFEFCGTVAQKYRQIGNAVPPPLAAAIGREFWKTILNSSKR